MSEGSVLGYVFLYLFFILILFSMIFLIFFAKWQIYGPKFAKMYHSISNKIKLKFDKDKPKIQKGAVIESSTLSDDLEERELKAQSAQELLTIQKERLNQQKLVQKLEKEIEQKKVDSEQKKLDKSEQKQIKMEQKEEQAANKAKQKQLREEKKSAKKQQKQNSKTSDLDVAPLDSSEKIEEKSDINDIIDEKEEKN